MELRYKISSRILIMAMIGAIMICASYLMFIYDPVSLIIKKVLTISPGSIIYNIFSNPPFEILIKARIFNVTNPDEFYSGREKLKVNEIGPYVYKEVLENINSTFNDNGTISYTQRRYIEFMRDLSIGDPKVDTIISPNIPLVGIAAALQDSSMFVNMAVSSVAHYLGSKPFVNLTIDEYLWGYDDPLVELANNVVPNWIDFPRFGILERMMKMDNSSNLITMNLYPTKDQISSNTLLTEEERLMTYSIQRWNGSPGLPQWGYVETEGNKTNSANSKCNLVEGTFESGLYSPLVNRPNATFRMYRHAFCRPVTFNYEGEAVSRDGLNGNQFRVASNFLGTPEENPENSCYCIKGYCPPSGMAFLSPCYYDIPITISQPHFFNADPVLQDQIIGFEPDVEKHDSTIILHSDMGIVIQASLRIQINLLVGDTKFNSKTKPFNQKVLPLFSLELEINSLPFTIYAILVLLYTVLPVVFTVLIYLLAIVGVCMVSGSALMLIVAPGTEEDCGNYSPIPVLPLAAQYFRPEIRISK